MADFVITLVLLGLVGLCCWGIYAIWKVSNSLGDKIAASLVTIILLFITLVLLFAMFINLGFGPPLFPSGR